jgi:hypothetical protein
MPRDLDETNSILAHQGQNVPFYVPSRIFVFVANLRRNDNQPIQ